MKRTLALLALLACASISHAADKPISALGRLTTPGTNDLLVIVDRADVSQSTNGSTKAITVSNLLAGLQRAGGYQRVAAFAATNVFLATMNTNSGYLTNAGDFAATTPVWQLTMPPAVSPNSIFQLTALLEFTNANTSALNLFVYAGTNTNCIYGTVAGIASGPRHFTFSLNALQLDGSYTNQYFNYSNAGSHTNLAAGNYAGDLSQPWPLYVGVTANANCTNLIARRLYITEIAPP